MCPATSLSSLSFFLSSPLVATTTTTHLPTSLLSLWLDHDTTSEGLSHSVFSLSLSFSSLHPFSFPLSLSSHLLFRVSWGAIRCKLVTLLFFFPLLLPCSFLPTVQPSCLSLLVRALSHSFFPSYSLSYSSN